MQRQQTPRHNDLPKWPRTTTVSSSLHPTHILNLPKESATTAWLSCWLLWETTLTVDHAGNDSCFDALYADTHYDKCIQWIRPRVQTCCIQLSKHRGPNTRFLWSLGFQGWSSYLSKGRFLLIGMTSKLMHPISWVFKQLPMYSISLLPSLVKK